MIVKETGLLLLGCKNSIIPNDGRITEIYRFAFYGCTGLTSVTIPASVTSIGRSVFEGCTGLTSVTIPSSVISIENSMFAGCTGLASVTIPESVLTIKDLAFSDCLNLTDVVFAQESSLAVIGWAAFSNCVKLTSIALPDSVSTIGGSAFAGCIGLNNITLPASVTTIGDRAFYNCTDLTELIVSPTITAVGYFGYKGLIACVWEYDGTNAPPAENDFSESVIFGGWYTDPTMMNAFDLDRWLAEGHTAGKKLTLYTKLSKPEVLVPMMIERTAFETKILKPLKVALSVRDYLVFNAYFSLKEQGKKGIAEAYPVTEKKNIDIYVFNGSPNDLHELRKLEACILEYTNYTFEELAADHAFVEYEG